MTFYLRLLWFAARTASRAGMNYSGAAMAGGELRRRRAMAYQRLYEETIDQIFAAWQEDREASTGVTSTGSSR